MASPVVSLTCTVESTLEKIGACRLVIIIKIALSPYVFAYLRTNYTSATQQAMTKKLRSRDTTNMLRSLKATKIW